jgi:hypothetical protein
MEVVIPVAQRQLQVRSASMDIDDSRAKPVRVWLDIPTSDYLDTNNSIRLRFLRSIDNGATWLMVGAVRWSGGAVPDDGEGSGPNPRPSMEMNLAPHRGQIFCVELDIPTRMRAGATIVY